MGNGHLYRCQLERAAAPESDSESPSSHSRGDWHPEGKRLAQGHTAESRLDGTAQAPSLGAPCRMLGAGLKMHPRQLPGRLTLVLEGTGDTGRVLRIYHCWQTFPSDISLWWPGLCLPLPWSPLSENRGGGCSVAKSYLILCDPMDRTLPGSSVHEISQVRILE